MSIEEKYDEVRQLINIGKEKGYLLYDEVNELLPSEITSSDELDDLFNTFGSAGIEVIDSDQKYMRDDKPIDRTAEGSEELELDLTPGALDKTNDPGPDVPARDGHRAAPHARRRSRDRAAHRARQAGGDQVDFAHAAGLAQGDSARRRLAHRRPDDPRARHLQRRRDHRRAHRRAVASGAEADRRGPQGQSRRREAAGKAQRNAEGRDDARQAEVPQGALAGDARARRGVAAHPRNRVHRVDQAPTDRRDEGRRSRTSRRSSGRSKRSIGCSTRRTRSRSSAKKTRRTSSGRSRISGSSCKR